MRLILHERTIMLIEFDAFYVYKALLTIEEKKYLLEIKLLGFIYRNRER